MRRKIGIAWFLLSCITLLLFPVFSVLSSPQLSLLRIWIRNGRLPKAARPRRDASEYPISMPREEVTFKELHSLLIHRIYHEDTLLQQRNYNFITTNAFLGAGFAVVVAIEPTKAGHVSMFGYVLAVFGFLWALLQVAYGKRQVIATTLWRQQAWMAEKTLGTKFDLTLFEYYERGETSTPFGILRMGFP